MTQATTTLTRAEIAAAVKPAIDEDASHRSVIAADDRDHSSGLQDRRSFRPAALAILAGHRCAHSEYEPATLLSEVKIAMEWISREADDSRRALLSQVCGFDLRPDREGVVTHRHFGKWTRLRMGDK